MVKKTPIKRQRLSNDKKIYDPPVWCLKETHFKYEDTSKLKLKELMEKDVS